MKIKKIALILLSLVMAFSIVACGKAKDNKKKDDNGKGNTTVTATPRRDRAEDCRRRRQGQLSLQH